MSEKLNLFAFEERNGFVSFLYCVDEDLSPDPAQLEFRMNVAGFQFSSEGHERDVLDHYRR